MERDTILSAESSSTNATQAGLLAGAIDREPRAWEQLVEIYGPLVASWCRSCRLDTVLIADVVQEVFLAVSQSLAKFRSTPGHGAFRGWLWRITRSKIVDLLRREAGKPHAQGGSTALQRLAEIPDEVELPETEPSTPDAVVELTRRALVHIQNEFQASTWTAFWRTVIDGQSSALVANELKMTTAGVRQARSRVLRRLREYLDDNI